MRQRPGTAQDAIFLTLGDGTDTASIGVWAKVYERFRCAVIAGRFLRITGTLEAGAVHIVAARIEDTSPLLDPDFRHDGTRADDQP